MSVGSWIVGPLAAPECHRAARRGWLYLGRGLTGLLVGFVALVPLGWWTVGQTDNPAYLPGTLAGQAFLAIELLAVLMALVLGPAVLAGTLAGEKERGSLGLLLSTRVDAREIVLGRFLGKLSLVAAMLAAFWPFQVLFGVLWDLPWWTLLGLLALPMATAIGSGGLALAASSLARKGRNAMLATYALLAAFFLIVATLDLGGRSWGYRHGWITPFGPLQGAVWQGEASRLYASIATWVGVGLGGLVVAASRLRKVYLGEGDVRGGRDKKRFRKIPPVPDLRPMVWKERYIERTAALGWFGRLVSTLLVLYLGLGSLSMAIYAAWIFAVHGDDATFDSLVVGRVDRMFAQPAVIICILIQVAAGLRAAVTVSSERERGTWDGLLTSPLSGREILAGKLRGSAWALTPLIVAALMSWTLAAVVDALPLLEFAALISFTAVGVGFAVVVGVRASLACSTATRAMTATVAVGMASYAVAAVVAGILTLMILVTLIFGWFVTAQLGLSTRTRPWMPQWLPPVGFVGGTLGGLILLAIMIVAEARLRFDAIAGRTSVEPEDLPIVPRRRKPITAPEDRPEPQPAQA